MAHETGQSTGGPGRELLCRQLGITDTSLGFLLIIIAATLLSYWSVVIQRRGLCLTIQDETEEAARLPNVYPIKRKASAMIIGALGFFLCLALSSAREAEAGDDCVAKRSARVTVWASLFVLVAALLRLDDLDFVACCGQTAVQENSLEDEAVLEDSTLPD